MRLYTQFISTPPGNIPLSQRKNRHLLGLDADIEGIIVMGIFTLIDKTNCEWSAAILTTVGADLHGYG
jgi:hypothetical protein